MYYGAIRSTFDAMDNSIKSKLPEWTQNGINTMIEKLFGGLNEQQYQSKPWFQGPPGGSGLKKRKSTPALL